MAGTAGAVKVGYLTVISCRNISMSSGEALIGIAVEKRTQCELHRVIRYEGKKDSE